MNIWIDPKFVIFFSISNKMRECHVILGKDELIINNFVPTLCNYPLILFDTMWLLYLTALLSDLQISSRTITIKYRAISIIKCIVCNWNMRVTYVVRFTILFIYFISDNWCLLIFFCAICVMQEMGNVTISCYLQAGNYHILQTVCNIVWLCHIFVFL
jgi:hypothetical protein